MKKKVMMMNAGKCAVGDWDDWSRCSVTCGVGIRVRSRVFLNPEVDELMCPEIPLMEKENCIGKNIASPNFKPRQKLVKSTQF